MKSAWLGLAIALCGVGCAKSEAPDWTAACFEGRTFEAWDERWPAACEVDSDLDMDGEIDARQVTKFDAQGRMTEVSSDIRFVPVERWAYDDDGRVIVNEQDDRQGELAFREENDYDTEGRLIESRIDMDGDGSVDIVATPEYESCETDGSTQPCSVAFDVDGDGEPDGVNVTTHNREGRRESALQYDPSTQVTVAERYFYEDGVLSRTEVDIGNDGTVEEIYGTDYDEDGAQLRNWRDTNADGERDEWVELERQADGLRRVTTLYERGEAVDRRVSEYDERRNLILMSVRSEREPDADYDSVFRYDDAGNQVATARDFYPYGSADECHYVSYACWER